MSAGSPKPTCSLNRNKLGQTTVLPQQVTDPTILDSVAGFINDVATYSVQSELKDQIQWVRFENVDCDISENDDGDSFLIPLPIVLILGYSTGVQVWAIPANGEAVELFSWRHGSVRLVKFLPTPYKVNNSLQDIYAQSRPLIALCDTTTPGPHYCALSFISLKTGEQVKVIKFKNSILDVLANQRSVVVTFSEKIAVFNAFTLEDSLTVTTCYLSPGLYPNPVALGPRWLAYAEKNLITNKRSNGGNEGEGVQSYTATVIHAAKSLGKGLRELGETVASSLTGTTTCKPGSPGTLRSCGTVPAETIQKGIVTILDIENDNADEGFMAHFAAHSDAIVCLAFDSSGMLLLTADKRGHDFHVFRIHPHPAGSSLASVHHLYVLHRGDTTARVQEMCFSSDSRWIAVSTLRGTTHVFPVTPYGGNVGFRTHGTPFVVNRMSRFHKSAGLPAEGRSNSPVSLLEAPVISSLPYNNPRLSPFPHPTVIHPLAQIRQPLFIQVAGNLQHRPHAVSGRPRLNSSSEDNVQVALRISTCFAPSRAWFDNVTPTHEFLSKQQVKSLESLFIMSCNGSLIQYELDPHQANSISKERKCSDESPIELTIQAKAQWTLQRQPHWNDSSLPMNEQNMHYLPQTFRKNKRNKPAYIDDQWLSQVEIITHAGPHRRLWMGPQFTFKTYTIPKGSSLPSEGQTLEVGHSKPLNMPLATTYPVIESGSTSSCEQSPKLLDTYHRLGLTSGAGELQLREDLADAMMESPGLREAGGHCVIVSMKPHSPRIAKVVNPLGTVITVHSDDDTEVDIVEEVVIHENCDEALFRPVVASKPLIFIENKLSFSNNKTSALKTITSVSESTTSANRINSGNFERSISDENVENCHTIVDLENILVKAQTTIQSKLESKHQFKDEIKVQSITPLLSIPKNIKLDCNEKNTVQASQGSIQDTDSKTKLLNIDTEDQNALSAVLITTPDLMDAIDFTFASNSPKSNLASFSCDEFFKDDNFEDARDSPDQSITMDILIHNNKEQKYNDGLALQEEGTHIKKLRKPKSKLGVRLSNKASESFEKIEKENVSIAVQPQVIKKTWSSIVSSTPYFDDSLLNSLSDKHEIIDNEISQKDLLQIESLNDEDLPVLKNKLSVKISNKASDSYHKIEKENDEIISIAIQPPTLKKTWSSIVASTPNYDDSLIDALGLMDDTMLLKNNLLLQADSVKKLSDDDKQGNGSSQTETTESDDSASKVVVMDTEEDSAQIEGKVVIVKQGVEKLLKRKSKKKKK